MNQELHDKAWKLLEEKGFSLSEKMMIRSHFASIYKDEYPFISIKQEKRAEEYYSSDIEAIQSLYFKTRQEVMLANAIYENVKNNFNINEFIEMLKFTFRMLKIDSSWA